MYLTADAEEELTTMSADEAYVIGGLVDRNRHKNLCKDRAKDLVCLRLSALATVYYKGNSAAAAKLDYAISLRTV